MENIEKGMKGLESNLEGSTWLDEGVENICFRTWIKSLVSTITLTATLATLSAAQDFIEKI